MQYSWTSDRKGKKFHASALDTSLTGVTGLLTDSVNLEGFLRWCHNLILTKRKCQLNKSANFQTTII